MGFPTQSTALNQVDLESQRIMRFAVYDFWNRPLRNLLHSA